MNQRLPGRTVSLAAPIANLRLCADEIGSLVRHKKRPRWRWWVADAASGQVVAFVFGRRTYFAFRRLLVQLASAGLVVAATYRCLGRVQGPVCSPRNSPIGKVLMQRLERKQLTLCTRLKWPTRRKICFPKKQFFHDGLMALFVFYFFF